MLIGNLSQMQIYKSLTNNSYVGKNRYWIVLYIEDRVNSWPAMSLLNWTRRRGETFTGRNKKWEFSNLRVLSQRKSEYSAESGDIELH